MLAWLAVAHALRDAGYLPHLPTKLTPPPAPKPIIRPVIVKPVIPIPRPKHDIIEEVAKRIAEKHDILSLKELRGPGRQKHLVRARAAAYSICSDMGLTASFIGRYFGGRDHSTVLFGIRRHRGMSAIEAKKATGVWLT